MNSDSILSVLRASQVFQGLSEQDIIDIMDCGVIQEVTAGSNILKESQENNSCYVVLEGGVDVYLPAVEGGSPSRTNQISLNTLAPGDILGEYSLVDQQPTSASATASETTRLFMIHRDDFTTLTDRNERIGKQVYFNLVRGLIQRLREKDMELDLELV